MDSRDLPISKDSLQDLRHSIEQRLALSDRQLVGVADVDVMKSIFVVRHGLVQPPVVLVLDSAESVPIGVLPVRGGDQLTERIGGHQVEPAGETMLKAGLECVIGGVAVVLTAGIA